MVCVARGCWLCCDSCLTGLLVLRCVLITLIASGVFVAMSFGGLLTFDCLRLFDCLQVVFSVVIGLMFVLYGCGLCGLLVIACGCCDCVC